MSLKTTLLKFSYSTSVERIWFIFLPLLYFFFLISLSNSFVHKFKGILMQAIICLWELTKNQTHQLYWDTYIVQPDPWIFWKAPDSIEEILLPAKFLEQQNGTLHHKPNFALCRESNNTKRLYDSILEILILNTLLEYGTAGKNVRPADCLGNEKFLPWESENSWLALSSNKKIIRKPFSG